jgi:hypothetical protein
LEGDPEGAAPIYMVCGLSPDECDGQTENWCTVLQEVALPTSADPVEFLEAATEFCNTKLWG